MYLIVRYHRDGPSQVIKAGVTLEEAEEHCNDPPGPQVLIGLTVTSRRVVMPNSMDLADNLAAISDYGLFLLTWKYISSLQGRGF